MTNIRKLALVGLCWFMLLIKILTFIAEISILSTNQRILTI